MTKQHIYLTPEFCQAFANLTRDDQAAIMSLLNSPGDLSKQLASHIESHATTRPTGIRDTEVTEVSLRTRLKHNAVALNGFHLIQFQFAPSFDVSLDAVFLTNVSVWPVDSALEAA